MKREETIKLLDKIGLKFERGGSPDPTCPNYKEHIATIHEIIIQMNEAIEKIEIRVEYRYDGDTHETDLSAYEFKEELQSKFKSILDKEIK